MKNARKRATTSRAHSRARSKSPAGSSRSRTAVSPSVDLESRLPFPVHGALQLPAVTVTSYNVELRARGRFVGDMASSTAFTERIDAWRATAREAGNDPFGRIKTDDLSRKELERILHRGDADAAGIVQSALDDFARAFVEVIRQFRRHKWRHVEKIVVGGGFRQSRLGELAIGRAQSLLHDEDIAVDLCPVTDHPDEAGLIGAAHVLPRWMLRGFNGLLAVDIGGSNIRCGAITFRPTGKQHVRSTAVHHSSQWRHREEQASRRDIVDELIDMLKQSSSAARKKGIKLAPVVVVGCPGCIGIDGGIRRGAQNLPGGWDGARFHLPTLIAERLGSLSGHRPAVVMHNDAVIQGLSALPAMRDVAHWGILTIGTGLGNAAFARRDES